MYRQAATAVAAVFSIFALMAPADAAPRGYSMNLSPHDHAFRWAEANEPIRRGRTAERFELRDGDCGESDCDNPRYRSEIRANAGTVKGRVDRDIWYGWSFFNEAVPSFSRADALRLVFAQWKVEGPDPAVIRIIQMGRGEGNWSGCDPKVCNRSRANEDVVVQLDLMRDLRKWGSAQNDGHVCKLFNMQDRRGKWTDFVMRTNFGSDANGYLQIWVNGTLKCDYRGQLVPGDLVSGRTISHRRGIMSPYTTRWDTNRKGTPKPTLVAYFDEFIDGRSREFVDPAIRQAQNRRAKD